MINFMIFVIFMYILYKSGILETLMSCISIIVILLLAYFIVLRPLFERFENLKFYLFVFISGLICVGYLLYQLSAIASNFSNKSDKDEED